MDNKSKQVIISKLRDVIDPEIGLNIVDLGMVRDVLETDGNVTVKIALTVKACPLSATLEKDITNILSEIPGVVSTKVVMESMTKDELNALAGRLQKIREDQRAVGTAPGMSAGIDRLGKAGIQNVITIISGKGGVGKSFVTAMMAVELRRLGYEVGILDADITGPSIAKIFGLSGKPLADQNGVLPKVTRSGIKVMSMNLLLDKPDSPVIWRGPIINGVIRQLFNDVVWGDLHFMLVDLPPGTGDAPLTVFQSLPVDGAVVVSTPQDLAMLIVRKAINMAKQLNIPVAGLVENMSYMNCPHCHREIEMFSESGLERQCKEFGIEFLARLPFDPKVNRLADSGELESYASNEVSEMVVKVRNIISKSKGITTTPIAWKKA